MIKYPVDFLSELFNSMGIEKCELSVYEYVPQKIENKRDVFEIDASEFLDYFHSLKSNLNENQEIAIHSRVQKLEKTLHIPMIDFMPEELLHDDYVFLKKVLEDFKLKTGLIFSSGRSYHFYSPDLIDKEGWRKFMGTILRDQPRRDILDSKEKPIRRKELIDSRWVGHRLMAGYSALRLTNNSNQYKKVPELLRYIGV